MDWLYNRHGQATLFIYGDRFISKNGRNYGWLYNGHVYGLRDGKHIGWFEGGVLYDEGNRVLAFLYGATGRLPSVPGLGGIPGTPGIPGKPGRPGFSGIPGRPGYGGWSSQSLDDFFGAHL